jgi:hypothetical protein
LYVHAVCYAWGVTETDGGKEGRKNERKRGTSEMRWEREVKIAMKQNNLTPQDAVNWKIWQKMTEYLYPAY